MLGASRRRLWDRAFIFPKTGTARAFRERGLVYVYRGARWRARNTATTRCCPSRAARRTNLPLAEEAATGPLSEYRARHERADTVVTGDRNEV